MYDTLSTVEPQLRHLPPEGRGLEQRPAHEGAGPRARRILAGIAARLRSSHRRPITSEGVLAQIAARLRAPEGSDA